MYIINRKINSKHSHFQERVLIILADSLDVIDSPLRSRCQHGVKCMRRLMKKILVKD
jgi:hypothetical protein